MNYNEQIKWTALNTQGYPISIVECGVVRVIPAADFTKPPTEQFVNLHSSCYDAYHSLFRVIKEPQEAAKSTVQQKELKKDFIERNQHKPLFNSKTKLNTKEKLDAKLLLNKRPSNRGTNVMYRWVFEKIDTKEKFIVDSVKKFCEEQKITAWNNVYKFAKNKKPYQGWNIIKELLEEENA